MVAYGPLRDLLTRSNVTWADESPPRVRSEYMQ